MQYLSVVQSLEK
jgi:hypothetical protein